MLSLVLSTARSRREPLTAGKERREHHAGVRGGHNGIIARKNLGGTAASQNARKQRLNLS
eukprot:scaffold2527_cov337-Prasinococcus_capsulatus_cf.AAC.2